MAQEPAPEARLAEPDTALASLLGSLLAEVPEYAPPALPDDAVGLPLQKLDNRGGLKADAPGSLNREEPDGGRVVPGWARTAFRVLLFGIGGADFAVPLLMLNAAARVDGPIKQVPGQPDWHRGIYHFREQVLVVVDLPLLLGLGTRCTDPGYLLLIGDGRFAIACDALGDMPTTVPEAVRWRRPEDRRRAWLAGLMVGEMCVLLDAEAIDAKIRHV